MSSNTLPQKFGRSGTGGTGGSEIEGHFGPGNLII